MEAFPNWREYAVVQKRTKTGCIPTCYEMLARSSGISGIDFNSFQDDFDLDQDENRESNKNDFYSVADAVLKKYPSLRFECKEFITGKEKTDFLEKRIQEKKPTLLSLNMVAVGYTGYHIMPILEYENDEYTLLNALLQNNEVHTHTVSRQKIEETHDKFPGGREVAFLVEY